MTPECGIKLAGLFKCTGKNLSEILNLQDLEGKGIYITVGETILWSVDCAEQTIEELHMCIESNCMYCIKLH